jgi:hypothetical protein
MPMHLKHTCNDSWLEYTGNYYNHKNNGFFPQQFVPMSKIKNKNEWGIMIEEPNERVKKNPQTTQKMGLYIYLGIKNQMDFPREAHVTTFFN